MFPPLLLTAFLGGIGGAAVSYLGTKPAVVHANMTTTTPIQDGVTTLALNVDCPVEIRPKESDLLDITVHQEIQSDVITYVDLAFDESVADTANSKYYTVQIWEDVDHDSDPNTPDVRILKDVKVLVPATATDPEKHLQIRLTPGQGRTDFAAAWKYDADANWTPTGLTVLGALQPRATPEVTSKRIAKHRKEVRAHFLGSLLALDISHH